MGAGWENSTRSIWGVSHPGLSGSHFGSRPLWKLLSGSGSGIFRVHLVRLSFAGPRLLLAC